MIRKYCNEKYIVRAYVNNYMSAEYHDALRFDLRVSPKAKLAHSRAKIILPANFFTIHSYFLLPRSRALRNRGQETEDE